LLNFLKENVADRKSVPPRIYGLPVALKPLSDGLKLDQLHLCFVTKETNSLAGWWPEMAGFRQVIHWC